jgi:hypothetical protein
MLLLGMIASNGSLDTNMCARLSCRMSYWLIRGLWFGSTEGVFQSTFFLSFFLSFNFFSSSQLPQNASGSSYLATMSILHFVDCLRFEHGALRSLRARSYIAG